MRKQLTRAGYTFESAGRGKDYTITIQSLPEPPSAFENFAKREFGCGPQTNFRAMEEHFFLLFYDPEYQFLPANHQALYLQKIYQLDVSDQSLRNWQKLLVEKNWIAEDRAKVRYCLCRKGQPPLEITAEEYTQLWNKYFSLLNRGTNRSDALHIIYAENNGMPRKQYGFTENALTQEKIDELRRILENSG